MLYVISNYENQSKINVFQNMEKYYLNLMKRNLNSEYGLKAEDEKKNLDEIIVNIIIYLIDDAFKNNNFQQLKQKWDGMKINLQNFELNDKRDDEFIKLRKHFENLDFKNDPKILNGIYGYIEYENNKAFKGNKILKELGDQARKKDDYGREVDFGEDNQNGNLFQEKKKKMDDNFMKKVFEQLIIIIDIEDKNNLSYLFYRGKNKLTSERDYFSYENKELYDEEKEIEKNFIKYIDFIKQVENYMDQVINDIKLLKKIKMVLTKEIGKNGDLYYINCVSSYEDKDVEYKDENVLVNGIQGKIPGFIYLVNELCNDDYEGENITINC